MAMLATEADSVLFILLDYIMNGSISTELAVARLTEGGIERIL